MGIDWADPKVWFVIIALIAFNGPIALAAWKFQYVTGLADVLGRPIPTEAADATAEDPPGSALNVMLQEKRPDGKPSGTLSYSRVTGLIGAVVVASLFWVMSNVSIAVAILDPSQLPDILNGITKLFFVGAALFLPYAFNQLKALIQ